MCGKQWQTATLLMAGTCARCRARLPVSLALTQSVLRGDSLHQAACIVDTLQRRHFVRKAVAQGTSQQVEIRQKLGTVCTRLQTVARLQDVQLGHGLWQVMLDLTHLENSSVLQRWPLAELGRVNTCYCHWHGTLLALAFSTGSHSGAPQAGLLLINTATGMVTCVDFGVVLHTQDQPRLSSWSSKGYLLVKRRLVGVTKHTFSIVNTLGQVISCAVLNGAFMPASACWAPNGSAAVILHSRGLWLWAPRAGKMPEWTDIVGKGRLWDCCWSPDCCSLFICKAVPAEIVFWTFGQEQQLQAPPSTATKLHAAFCGSQGRIALLCDLRLGQLGAVSGTLVLCKVAAAGMLSPLRSLAAGTVSYTLSSAWERVLVPLWTPSLSGDRAMH